MPCEYWMPGEEAEHNRRETKRELDAVTAEADLLRELVLAFAKGEAPEVDAATLAKIEKRQVAHRRMDLDRLRATFRKSKDVVRLAAVQAADPRKPLKPQLGFDPDSF